MRYACIIALAAYLVAPLVAQQPQYFDRVSTAAQDSAPDETAIRRLIADWDAGKPVPRAPDDVFWSGAFTRPSAGGAGAPEKPGPRSISNRVPGSQRVKTTPIRIEVSHSGDMAWEFSNATTHLELKDGSKVHFDSSILRVWRKDASGRWTIAAHFARPHDD